VPQFFISNHSFPCIIFSLVFTAQSPPFFGEQEATIYPNHKIKIIDWTVDSTRFNQEADFKENLVQFVTKTEIKQTEKDHGCKLRWRSFKNKKEYEQETDKHVSTISTRISFFCTLIKSTHFYTKKISTHFINNNSLN